jgi:hypothetical protein
MGRKVRSARANLVAAFPAADRAAATAGITDVPAVQFDGDIG